MEVLFIKGDCVFACLFVSRISQKVTDRLNSVGKCNLKMWFGCRSGSGFGYRVVFSPHTFFNITFVAGVNACVSYRDNLAQIHILIQIWPVNMLGHGSHLRHRYRFTNKAANMQLPAMCS